VQFVEYCLLLLLDLLLDLLLEPLKKLLNFVFLIHNLVRELGLILLLDRQRHEM
jgi:hypothetical protein